MTKLDPQLANLVALRAADGAPRMHEMAAAPHEPVFFAAAAADDDDDPEVSVIVRFSGDIKDLEKAGFGTDTIAGNIATGSIKVSKLETLAKVSALETADAAVQVNASLDLSVPEIQADLVHSGPPGYRGSGVVVGVVDSGIDFTHGNFLSPTGSTRIARIWDQNLTPAAGESNPGSFTYGVEYDATEIDAALGTATPFTAVRHQDSGINHGTHVAGIAAGDGSLAGNGQPADTYVGVAPEATIVAVATDWSTSGVIDGVNYVFQTAQTLGLPAVVNLSLGSVIGPHDGTSNFEQGISNLVTGTGRVVVVAAGNEGSDNAHTSGTLAAGVTTTLSVNVPFGRGARVVLDLWYDGADTFNVTLTDPAGNTTGNVAVGTTTNTNLGTANVWVDHRNNDPNNNDKRVTVIINPPVGGNVPNGGWQLQLSAAGVAVGTYDAWINNPAGQPNVSFPAAQATAAGTIALPATANNVISVGSYITRGAGVGGLSTFSNRGPTRDGRAAPTITAPGQRIWSANRLTASEYQRMSGTSMACPHIAGVVALMLDKNASQTWTQIRDCLQSTARSDAFTGTPPNPQIWGAGKVDALAAVNCTPAPGPVFSRPPTICPPRSRFTPCIPFTRTLPCPPFTRTLPCPPVTRVLPCPPRTRIIPCIPPTRIPTICPVPITRVPIRCPVPLTRTPTSCPTPITRIPIRCPVPLTRTPTSCPTPITRSPLGCPGPFTRTPTSCPVPNTRSGLACPVTRAICPVPSRIDACPTRGICKPTDPRLPIRDRLSEEGYTEEELAAWEAYAEGFSEGYAAAYSEAYGTCQECSDPAETGEHEYYDESWFDENEFE